MRQFLRWFFRNRETGAITIVQAPNLVLWVVIAAAILRWITPAHAADAIFTVAVKVGLLVWAVDEILRGVNPWRRCLGAAVFCYVMVTVLV
jgi:hypothetical protein